MLKSLDVVHAGFGEASVPYDQAWALQRQVHEDVVTGRRPSTVLLLEHPPVYTAGKRTNSWERPTDGTPVVDVDRGGRITWHGPGQLVGYPIIKLDDPIDVVAYVRRVEALLIEVCAEFGVQGVRVDGRSGVWLSGRAGLLDQKLGAIGVRVSRGVTMHGFALNCDCDLAAFKTIVPCGITDAEVTSLTQEVGHAVTVSDVVSVVESKLQLLLDGPVAATDLERSAS
jgi:lipoyl(octanoyl) transferase